jgi:hypothetical protein
MIVLSIPAGITLGIVWLLNRKDTYPKKLICIDNRANSVRRLRRNPIAVLIQDFRLNYLNNQRLTKQRCEEFFSNDKNFVYL